MARFVSIKEIVEDASKRFESLYWGIIEEIEVRGIYLLNEFCQPNSKNAQQALMCLASLHFSEWVELPEKDPVLEEIKHIAPNYGWPEDALPEFKHSRDAVVLLDDFFRFRWKEEFSDVGLPHWVRVPSETRFYFEELYTITRVILTRKATTAQIADEIERHGLYGFELAGRIRLYKKEDASNICEKVINGLTDVYEEQSQIGRLPTYAILHEPMFSRFGWRHDALPKFLQNKADGNLPSSPENGAVVIAQEGDLGPLADGIIPSNPRAKKKDRGGMDRRVEQTYDLTICGLIAIILGDLSLSSGLPAAKSGKEANQSDIIKLLLSKLNGKGLSESSLGNYFAKANKYRDRYGLPPLK
jgi:hypothetical protein